MKKSTDRSSYQSGFVLLTTLTLITLVALLTLAQMRLFLLDLKTVSLISKNHHDFFALESVANKLLQSSQSLDREACILSEQDPNEVLNVLNNKKGCIVWHEQQRFYYLIEDLGVFPCLQVRLNQQNFSTKHGRLSLRLADKKGAIIQIRYARLASLMPCEANELREFKTGLLSWRYLA